MTYKNVPAWHRDVDRVCGKIPIVLVGNKVDTKERKVKAKNITFHRRKNITYFDISARSNYNIDKPFIRIIRDITGDQHLNLTEEPAHAPAEIHMDAAQIAELNRQAEETIALALNTAIPDEDEDL